MPWKLTWREDVYREADITLGQAEQIEDLTGSTWQRINPLASARYAVAILSVLAAERTDRPVAEVAAEVKAIKSSDYFEMWAAEDDDTPSTYEDGNPPEAAAISTDTSSSA